MRSEVMVSFPCSFKCLSSVVFLFLLVFLAATRTEVDAVVPFDPLYPKCMVAVGTGRYFDIKFCMDALHSGNNGGHYVSDYKILSIVIMDLLTANTTSTAAKIVSLLEKGDGGHMRWCLLSCQALYGSMLQMQPRCLYLVKAFRFDEAKSCLDQVARATELCEAEFVRIHMASPLKAEDDWAFKLARLAYALVEHAND